MYTRNTIYLKASFLILASVLYSPNGGAAQTLDGTIQFGADLGLLRYENELAETPSGDDVETTRLQLSFLSVGVGLSLSANLSEKLSIGGRLFLERDSTTVDEAEVVELNWQIGPTLELRFVSEGAVRPFGRAGLYLSGSNLQMGDEDAVKSKFFGFQIGGGVHIFPHERVSIDPQLEFNYRTLLGEGNATRWTFGLLVGITTWLGEPSEDAISTADADATQATGQDTQATYQAPEVAVSPVISFAREGERKVGVRLVLESGGLEQTFTFVPTESASSTRVDVRNTRQNARLGTCNLYTVGNGSDLLSEPFVTGSDYNGRSAMLPMNEFMQATQGRVVSGRVCGRSWRPTPQEQAAIRSFLEEAWQIREVRDSIVPTPEVELEGADRVEQTD